MVTLILALCLVLDEEINPKGFDVPDVRKGKLVELEEVDHTTRVPDKETEVRTYFDSKTESRFKTYEVQNNIYRYDFQEKTYLDRDGDGLFEARVPLEEAGKEVPPWVVEMTMAPQKILNSDRMPVVREARLLKKSARQTGRAGGPLPVLVLFFVEETDLLKDEDQVNPSVAAALILRQMKEEYDGKVLCVGFRFERRSDREMKDNLGLVSATLGCRVKSLPSFRLFEVYQGVDRRSKQTVYLLRERAKLSEKVVLRETMEKTRARLSKSIQGALRKMR
jgi:hypothetical protein